MPEQVYMVWDIYDGVRSGIADFNGQPHYFKSNWDVEVEDCSELFSMKKIDAETLEIALEQWAIFRQWEVDYHSGKVSLETHPGHSGVDGRYDELELILKQRIRDAPRTAQVYAEFQPREHQTKRPKGCLLDMEVVWT